MTWLLPSWLEDSLRHFFRAFVMIYDALRLYFQAWKIIFEWGLNFIRIVGAGLGTVVIGFVMLMPFIFDLAQMLADGLAGKGTIANLLGVAMGGGSLSASILFPAVSGLGAVATSWADVALYVIPFPELFNLLVGLLSGFVIAASFRTVKAFIPTIS